MQYWLRKPFRRHRTTITGSGCPRSRFRRVCRGSGRKDAAEQGGRKYNEWLSLVPEVKRMKIDLEKEEDGRWIAEVPELSELFALSAGVNGPPLKRGPFLPRSFVSAGRSSKKQPVPIVYYQGRNGPIMYLFFMMAKRSGRACWLESPRERSYVRKIYNG
jgi:hypothetical protein